MLLIAKQPDLGTAVTLIPVFIGMAFLAGLRTQLLGVFVLIAMLGGALAWQFALKDYQKSRSRPSSIPIRIREVRGISRFRPASRSVPEG